MDKVIRMDYYGQGNHAAYIHNNGQNNKPDPNFTLV